ncbi:flagellar assembly protein FliW [Ilumatobacter sp.]|uniref:flagellar assembly protein FliW n=1 Tax=Ilumatobacter sp. TaxID=1967498 RepID=UPI003B528A50
MQVETTRFGTIEVDDGEVLTFPDGLPGFRGRRRMVLVGAGGLLGFDGPDAEHSLYWLQDVDDRDLAFLTTVPWVAYPEYDVDVDVDGAALDDLCVLVMVTIRRDGDRATLTTNLLAPVLIDTTRRVGRQVILEDGDWPVRAPLAESQPIGAS